jgi:hypothetical protein
MLGVILLVRTEEWVSETEGSLRGRWEVRMGKLNEITQ